MAPTCREGGVRRWSLGDQLNDGDHGSKQTTQGAEEAEDACDDPQVLCHCHISHRFQRQLHPEFEWEPVTRILRRCQQIITAAHQRNCRSPEIVGILTLFGDGAEEGGRGSKARSRRAPGGADSRTSWGMCCWAAGQLDSDSHLHAYGGTHSDADTECVGGHQRRSNHGLLGRSTGQQHHWMSHASDRYIRTLLPGHASVDTASMPRHLKTRSAAAPEPDIRSRRRSRSDLPVSECSHRSDLHTPAANADSRCHRGGMEFWRTIHRAQLLEPGH